MATTTRMCGSRSWRRDVPKQQVDKFTAARDVKSRINKHQKQEDRHAVCTYWMSDRCVYGENCRYLHSWVLGDGVERIAQLRGHKQAVSGIKLPSCSDKLFTGSSDGTLRLWDCSTGKCDEKGNVFSMGTEVGCLISEGPLVFIGVLDAVWAWNIETCATLNLTGPVGQVHAMAVANQTLFAACQNGDILAWKPCLETHTFKLVAKLIGHTKAALSLSVGGDRLYSGSADNTIRVWDIHTLQCIQTLSGHSGPVTCLICWDSYLISGSLDATLKVWVCEQDGKIEEFYSHKEQRGILALNGVTGFGADAKPILFASCKDGSVHLYNLPNFHECGRLFTRQDVRSIQIIEARGLIFTGDSSGNVDVWRWLGQPSRIVRHGK